MKRVVKRKRINVSAFQWLSLLFSTRKQELKAGLPLDVVAIFRFGTKQTVALQVLGSSCVDVTAAGFIFQMSWLKGLFCSIFYYGYSYSSTTFTCH